MLSKTTVEQVAPLLAELFPKRNTYTLGLIGTGEAKEISVSVHQISSSQIGRIFQMYVHLIAQEEEVEYDLIFNPTGILIKFYNPISTDDLKF